MANREEGYGMDAELAAKLRQKYDSGMEEDVREWVQAAIGVVLPNGPDEIHAALKDGSVLAKLANALKPDSFKLTDPLKMPFKQMEMINGFITVARDLGVPTTCLFQTADLFDNSNMLQVMQCLNVLRTTVAGRVFKSTASKVIPSDNSVMPAQAGFTGGASQSGMSFGLKRQMTTKTDLEKTEFVAPKE